MKLHEHINQLFFKGQATKNISENIEEYSLILKSTYMSIPSEQKLVEIKNMINSRDIISLTVQLDDGEPIELSWDRPQDFVSDIKNLFVLKSDDTIFTLQTTISKRKNDNVVSVYNLSEFSNYLNSLTLKVILFNFDKLLKENLIILHVLDDSEGLPIHTKSIIFTNNPVMCQADNTYRENLMKKRNEVCSYLNAGEYDFIPEDFVCLSRCNNTYLNYIFKKLSIIISLIYISNVSSIDGDNTFKYRIEGYKWSNFILDYSNMSVESLSSFYESYLWIYTGGNLSDKIGLARNIISLHLANRNDVGLDSSALEAIKSNYNIYLRENVAKYLEVKSKVTEFLFDMNQKLSESANSITKNFISNLLAILTFFVTVIIANSISDNRLQNIFTRDITAIAAIIVILSCIYLWYSVYEVDREKKRLGIVYERLKVAYKEILAPEDIKIIFNNDKSFNEDMTYIESKVKDYSRLWILSLIIIALGIIFLASNTISNELQFLINSFKK